MATLKRHADDDQDRTSRLTRREMTGRFIDTAAYLCQRSETSPWGMLSCGVTFRDHGWGRFLVKLKTKVCIQVILGASFVVLEKIPRGSGDLSKHLSETVSIIDYKRRLIDMIEENEKTIIPV